MATWFHQEMYIQNREVITGESGKNEIFATKLFKDGKLVSMIRWRFHVTTNANGEVTAFMDKWDVDCK